jgi:hypothetical protein
VHAEAAAAWSTEYDRYLKRPGVTHSRLDFIRSPANRTTRVSGSRTPGSRIYLSRPVCRQDPLAFPVAPFLIRLVLAFKIERSGAPIVLFPRNVVCTLQAQDSLSGSGEPVGRRPTARSVPMIITS